MYERNVMWNEWVKAHHYMCTVITKEALNCCSCTGFSYINVRAMYELYNHNGWRLTSTTYEVLFFINKMKMEIGKQKGKEPFSETMSFSKCFFVHFQLAKINVHS